MKKKILDFLLRWLGRWLGKNKPEIAREIDKGIDAEISEPEKKISWLRRYLKGNPVKSQHVQTPLIVPKRTARHDVPAGQRGGNRAK